MFVGGISTGRRAFIAVTIAASVSAFGTASGTGCTSPAPSTPAPSTAPVQPDPPSSPALPAPQAESPAQAQGPIRSTPPAPKAKHSEGHWERLKVVATAYNSVPDQTSDHPFLGAWGDKLVPGSKVIAVSRDLLKLGLHHNSVVHISGLEGTYKVRDKMAARWTKTIVIEVNV